jgi:signal transduction histidine kinase
VVEGECCEAARRFFNCNVELVLLTTQSSEEEGSYTSWRVSYVSRVDPSLPITPINDCSNVTSAEFSPLPTSTMDALKGLCPHHAARSRSQSSDIISNPSPPSAAPDQPSFGLSSSQLSRLFPFHIAFDRDLKIKQLGKYVKDFVLDIEVGKNIDVFFKMSTAPFSWGWEALVPLAEVNEVGIKSLPSRSRRQTDISLIGNISFSDNLDTAFLLLTPNVKTFSDMVQWEMNMTHLVGQNARLEAVLQHENMMSATEENSALQELTKMLEEERGSTFKLMQEVTNATQEALAVKKTFVRYVSHEIRTPLTVVQLGLSLLRDQVSLLPTELPAQNEVVENIHNCHESVDIAVSILGDLLSYEMLESGILVINKKPVELVKYVTAAVAPFRLQGRHRGISVEIQHDDPQLDDLYLSIDSGKMAQAVRNLLSNALKFSPEGSTVVIRLKWVDAPTQEEQVNVETSCDTSTVGESMGDLPKGVLSTSIIRNMKCMRDFEQKLYPKLFEADKDVELGINFVAAGRILIEFIDQGVGVTPENQAKMFKGIAQFNPEVLESAGGSGLGLWISNGITQIHGGCVSVVSEGAGKGSCFTLQLPSYRLKHSASLSPAQIADIDLAASIVQHELTRLASNTKKIQKHRPLPVYVPPKDIVSARVEPSPLARSPYSPPVSSPASPAPASPSTSPSLFANKRVLIVDDVKMVRKLLEKNLIIRGAICSQAEDGIDAVQKFKKTLEMDIEKFDLILIDFVMPNMVSLRCIYLAFIVLLVLNDCV